MGPSNTHSRNFEITPLQTGLETTSFSSTALRFERDIVREKLLAYHEAEGIVPVWDMPRKPLVFGEECVRRFALKSVAAARAAIEVIGDIADDVVELIEGSEDISIAKNKLMEINDGEYQFEAPLDLSIYTFIPDLTDPLEVGFIKRRKKFVKIGRTRVPPPALEPPILKDKETEKRKDRKAREKALFEISEKKKNAYKKRRYDMQQKQKKLADKRYKDKQRILQWRRQEMMEKSEEERKRKIKN